MTNPLGTCLIIAAFGAALGCGSSPEPKPREPRALEPLSESAKIRQTQTFEEPVLTPASRKLTNEEQKKKPKSAPETESAPPVEQPKTKQPHPMSDETWGTVPWGDGPWGE